MPAPIRSPIVSAMSDAFGPGKMMSSVDDGVLTIQRRTYRSGDFVHVIFSGFAVLFAVLFLYMGIAFGTLFDALTFPIVILLLLAYGYFGVTRLVDRRTVTVSQGVVTARDGPLPLLVRTIDSNISDLGRLSVESSPRWTFPPIMTYRVYSAHTENGPDLFRRLRSRGEAAFAVATIQAFVGSSGD